jgi:hypothetical protein
MLYWGIYILIVLRKSLLFRLYFQLGSVFMDFLWRLKQDWRNVFEENGGREKGLLRWK